MAPKNVINVATKNAQIVSKPFLTVSEHRAERSYHLRHQHRAAQYDLSLQLRGCQIFQHSKTGKNIPNDH
jgi:hypothetical protein